MKLRPFALLRRAVTLLFLLLVPAARPASVLAAPARSLTVFAAASLADAFQDLAHRFEAAHKDVKVRMSFLGSQQLAAQLAQGAPADVFASADDRSMEGAKAAGRIAGDPVTFAYNRLVVIVPRTNPARIGGLKDLARHGVKFVLGAESVPVGHYSREVLANLAQRPGFGPDFARRALSNLVSEEENVKAVVGKVQLGEADAGMCYRSDVTAAVSRYVTMFAIPDSASVLASYPIAVVTASASPELAQAFVDLVRSPAGQGALIAHGLIPAGASGP